MDQDRHTAIHDAGHMVAHIRLGIDQGGGSIVPDEDAGTLGRAHASGWVESVDQAKEQILTYLAGYAALVAVGGAGDDDASLGAVDDFERAGELVAAWSLGTLDEWKARAVALMAEPSNIKAVRLIADRLLALGEVDGEWADVLVEYADCKCTDADLAGYQAWRDSCSGRASCN